MQRRLAWLLCALPVGSRACTLIAATVGASTDGSSLVGSTNDCQDCDSRLAKVPAQSWPEGSMRIVYQSDDTYPREVGTNRTSIYASVDGQKPSIPFGFIPQVAHTYAYWEAIYGFMNEHGLGMAESSCPSKFVNLREMGAMLSIRELTRLAMERCKTARCGVQTAGSLAEKYGFYGEDPDLSGAGDSLAFADGKETWIFHVSGEPTGRSAFWVAQRIPDGHVAVISNTFIIREVQCSGSADFYCSTDLERKLKETGEWSGEGPLDWSVVVPPDLKTHSYVVNGYDAGPIPYYVTARTWRTLSKLAPSLGLTLNDNVHSYPFSVRPDKRLTHRNFMDLWRDNFEGTEIDMTVGGMAGPFSNPYRPDAGVGLEIAKGQFTRGFALPRTNAVFVSQTFGEGGINKLWVGQDTPTATVLVPFYASTMLCDQSYSIGNMSVYDDRSAWWVFDFAANWMGLNYRLMSVDVRAKIEEVQDDIDDRSGKVEHAAREKLRAGDSAGATSLLSQHQEEVQGRTVDTWRRFSHFLIMKYNDGYLNDKVYGTPIGYPAWWLQMFGVDNKITPKWCQASAEEPVYYKELGPGPYETLPKGFKAIYPKSLAASAPSLDMNPTWSVLVVSVAASLSLGYALGRRPASIVHPSMAHESYCALPKSSC